MFTAQISGDVQVLFQAPHEAPEKTFITEAEPLELEVASDCWLRIKPMAGTASVRLVTGDAPLQWRPQDRAASPHEATIIGAGETATLQIEWPLWAVVEEVEG